MERKIKMVIQNKEVDEYIATDITDIDMKQLAENRSLIEESDYEVHTKNILYDKLAFRAKFADKLSLIKLTYIYCVLTNIYEKKASLSDPKAFKDKVKSIERAWKN